MKELINCDGRSKMVSAFRKTGKLKKKLGKYIESRVFGESAVMNTRILSAVGECVGYMAAGNHHRGAFLLQALKESGRHEVINFR